MVDKDNNEHGFVRSDEIDLDEFYLGGRNDTTGGLKQTNDQLSEKKWKLDGSLFSAEHGFSSPISEKIQTHENEQTTQNSENTDDLMSPFSTASTASKEMAFANASKALSDDQIIDEILDTNVGNDIQPQTPSPTAEKDDVDLVSTSRKVPSDEVDDSFIDDTDQINNLARLNAFSEKLQNASKSFSQINDSLEILSGDIDDTNRRYIDYFENNEVNPTDEHQSEQTKTAERPTSKFSEFSSEDSDIKTEIDLDHALLTVDLDNKIDQLEEQLEKSREHYDKLNLPAVADNDHHSRYYQYQTLVDEDESLSDFEGESTSQVLHLVDPRTLQNITLSEEDKTSFMSEEDQSEKVDDILNEVEESNLTESQQTVEQPIVPEPTHTTSVVMQQSQSSSTVPLKKAENVDYSDILSELKKQAVSQVQSVVQSELDRLRDAKMKLDSEVAEFNRKRNLESELDQLHNRFAALMTDFPTKSEKVVIADKDSNTILLSTQQQKKSDSESNFTHQSYETDGDFANKHEQSFSPKAQTTSADDVVATLISQTPLEDFTGTSKSSENNVIDSFVSFNSTAAVLNATKEVPAFSSSEASSSVVESSDKHSKQDNSEALSSIWKQIESTVKDSMMPSLVSKKTDQQQSVSSASDPVLSDVSDDIPAEEISKIEAQRATILNATREIFEDSNDSQPTKSVANVAVSESATRQLEHLLPEPIKQQEVVKSQDVNIMNEVEQIKKEIASLRTMLKNNEAANKLKTKILTDSVEASEKLDKLITETISKEIEHQTAEQITSELVLNDSLFDMRNALRHRKVGDELEEQKRLYDLERLRYQLKSEILSELANNNGVNSRNKFAPSVKDDFRYDPYENDYLDIDDDLSAFITGELDKETANNRTAPPTTQSFNDLSPRPASLIFHNDKSNLKGRELISKYAKEIMNKRIKKKY